jgi:hypothetical protein
MDRRVASIFTSFGAAGCTSLRLPSRVAPPVSPTIRFRVAPVPHPPAPASHRPSHLGPHAIRFALPEPLDYSSCSCLASPTDSSQVALKLASFGGHRFRLSRVAPKLSSSADPYLLPQVAPASTSTAGSMITSWLNRTLHPRLAPRMNLRLQSGTNCPDAGFQRTLNLNPSVHNRPIMNF